LTATSEPNVITIVTINQGITGPIGNEAILQARKSNGASSLSLVRVEVKAELIAEIPHFAAHIRQYKTRISGRRFHIRFNVSEIIRTTREIS